MKSLQEIYDEIIASDELKSSFLAAAKQGQDKVVDFLKANGCDAAFEEVKAFLEEKSNDLKDVSDEELSNIAGGKPEGSAVKNAVLSFATVFGCVVGATVSTFVNTSKGTDPNDPSVLNCFNAMD